MVETYFQTCDCKWLERAAADPHVPIVFDHDLNEYHITRIGPLGGILPIYHCPLCGGSAPKSKRADFFAVITPEELQRLQDLTCTIRTVADLIATLGVPDEDIAQGYGETQRGRDDGPARMDFYQTLRYNNLSKMAIVDVIVHTPEKIRFSYMPKYIGNHGG